MARSTNKQVDHAFKRTPQRLAILEYLQGSTIHPAAEDVYDFVRKQFPTISLATVYNTLEMLRRQGAVAELAIDPSRKRFDPNPEPHDHLVCVGCRRIEDVRSRGAYGLSASERCGFQIIGTHVEFYGVCPKCRAA